MTGQVIISGATGSIGISLSKTLHEAGRNIAVVTRDMDRARKSVPYASWSVFESEIPMEPVAPEMITCPVIYV